MKQLGRYEVREELARGGMGAVLRAHDPASSRDVAIKLLLAGAQATTRQRERFRREAEALARLRHPNVVTVHDVSESDGVPFLVMDLVSGASLQDRLDADGPLAPAEAASHLVKLARAVEHAHSKGILHRDIKPANVLLRDDGVPCLTDFGLARDVTLPEQADGTPAAPSGGIEQIRVSQSGAILGTTGYMPPEQAAGERDAIGPRSDVYALGATLYAALTGRAPHEGIGLQEVLRATVEDAPRAPSDIRPGIDLELERICLRCLEKRPDDRYGSAADLARDLERYQREGPRLTVGWTALAPLLVLLAGCLLAMPWVAYGFAVPLSIVSISASAGLLVGRRRGSAALAYGLFAAMLGGFFLLAGTRSRTVQEKVPELPVVWALVALPGAGLVLRELLRIARAGVARAVREVLFGFLVASLLLSLAATYLDWIEPQGKDIAMGYVLALGAIGGLVLERKRAPGWAVWAGFSLLVGAGLACLPSLVEHIREKHTDEAYLLGMVICGQGVVTALIGALLTGLRAR